MQTSAARALGRALLGMIAAAALAGVAAAAEVPGLARARAQWQAAHVGDYRYEYQKVCQCHPEDPATTVVTVRDSKVEEVRYRVRGLPDVVLASDRIAWYWTVEDLFALIESAGENPSLKVAFDPELGYPVRVYIDPVPALEGDEIDVRVTGFTALTD